MITPPKTLLVLMAFLLLLAAPADVTAAPTKYLLDTKASRIEFIFIMGGGRQKGIMPVLSSLIIVNPANLTLSRVDISLDVAGVRTPLPFVKPALIGPKVLDAARYPTIRFVSDRITLGPAGRLSDGAKITGNLTMHGVTRPVTFDAGLFRAPDTAPDDLGVLSIKLSGQISRSAFGATGFSDFVGDIIGLNISAVIRAP
ncbi:MAG: YceI family protein [Rhodobacteraceae bacterium]|nr:YceI family protein [Paracoccaceae bacterium]